MKEHFYDGESGSGLSGVESYNCTVSELTGGPAARREISVSPEMSLTEEQCKEAMTLMRYYSDEATIKQKMKIPF